jgi:hypothetical protein
MGKDAGSAPQAPDPKTIIGAQATADKNAFNYQTDANRFNTVGPDQSQTWDKTSVFDENAYNKALKDWQSTAAQGTWVPPVEANPGMAGGENGTVYGATPAVGGHWEGGSGPKGDMPNQSDFTTNKYNLTTTLSPEQQKLHDLQTGLTSDKTSLASALMDKLKGTLGSSFDTSSVPGLTTDPGTKGYMDKLSGLDPTQFNTTAADALYKQQTRYLDPQVQDQQRALEARLSEQGFVPGTPGYEQAMRTFQDTNNRQYGAARDSATALGSQVGHTQFSDASGNLNSLISSALQDAQFQNQAHGQGVQDLLQQRQVPLSDLNTVMSFLGGGGGGPAPTNAGSAAVPQGGVGALQNPDQISAYNDQYKALLGNYNANVSSDNSTTSSIVGVIGAIAAAY